MLMRLWRLLHRTFIESALCCPLTWLWNWTVSLVKAVRSQWVKQTCGLDSFFPLALQYVTAVTNQKQQLGLTALGHLGTSGNDTVLLHCIAMCAIFTIVIQRYNKDWRLRKTLTIKTIQWGEYLWGLERYPANQCCPPPIWWRFLPDHSCIEMVPQTCNGILCLLFLGRVLKNTFVVVLVSASVQP